jgi:hypothetical protein
MREAFHILTLVWFLGWGFLLVKFPAHGYRLLTWGRTPTARQLKTATIIGYIGLGFGFLYLFEIIFGMVR